MARGYPHNWGPGSRFATREEYNAYMREYMRWYRSLVGRHGKLGRRNGEVEPWAVYRARKRAERQAAKEAAARLNATASLSVDETGRVSTAGHPPLEHPQHNGREEEPSRDPLGPRHGPRRQEPEDGEQQDAEDEQQAQHG